MPDYIELELGERVMTSMHEEAKRIVRILDELPTPPGISLTIVALACMELLDRPRAPTWEQFLDWFQRCQRTTPDA